MRPGPTIVIAYVRRGLPLIALALATTISLITGATFAWLARPTIAFVEPAALTRLHAGEVALAREAGLTTLVEEGDASEGPFVRDVPLSAGECVALVASLEGSARFTEITLGPPTFANPPASDDVVVHRARCAAFATTIHVALAWGEASANAPARLRFTILRGRVATPRAYAALVTTTEDRARLDAEAVRARLASLGGDELAPPVVILRERATVLPSERASLAAARAITGRAGVVPRLDQDEGSTDPFTRPGEREIAPRALTSQGYARLLLVLDAGALEAAHGGACLDVILARLDDPLAPTPLRRVAIPSLEEVLVPSADGAIARDSVCVEEGLYAYVVGEDVGASYLLSVRARPGERVATARPSRFSEGSGATVATLEPTIVATSRAACASGDASACHLWAALADAEVFGAGVVREPLERGCALGDAGACDRLAAIYAASSEPRLMESSERRACALGRADACLRRAARFRDEDRFQEAYETYAFLCARPGGSEGCAGAGTMREWQLAPSGASEAGPAPSAPP